MTNSFEGVEEIASFANADAIEAYRANRLNKVALHGDWLARQTSRPSPFVVVDVGAGSSCLLYSFANSGNLSHGVAIEPARSRHQFAERWRLDGGYDHVENVCATFDQILPRRASADMVLLLDNTLSYMYSQNERHPQLVASMAAEWLRPGGILVIEVLDYASMPRCEQYIETPLDPRFRASSYYIELLTDGTVISETTSHPRNGNAPIKKRDGAKCVRKEHLAQVLENVGFTDIRFFTEGVPWLKDATYPHCVAVAVCG
jgi:SAM-dependent methyltransferase